MYRDFGFMLLVIGFIIILCGVDYLGRLYKLRKEFRDKLSNAPVDTSIINQIKINYVKDKANLFSSCLAITAGIIFLALIFYILITTSASNSN